MSPACPLAPSAPRYSWTQTLTRSWSTLRSFRCGNTLLCRTGAGYGRDPGVGGKSYTSNDGADGGPLLPSQGSGVFCVMAVRYAAMYITDRAAGLSAWNTRENSPCRDMAVLQSFMEKNVFSCKGLTGPSQGFGSRTSRPFPFGWDGILAWHLTGLWDFFTGSLQRKIPRPISLHMDSKSR